MFQSRSSTIQRCPHDEKNPYVMVCNSLIRDASLSPNARWLAIYLLSNKDEWSISVQQIINHVNPHMKRDKVYSIVKELIEAGYMKKEQHIGPNGFGPVTYYLSEKPKFQKSFTLTDLSNADLSNAPKSTLRKNIDKEGLYTKETTNSAPDKTSFSNNSYERETSQIGKGDLPNPKGSPPTPIPDTKPDAKPDKTTTEPPDPQRTGPLQARPLRSAVAVSSEEMAFKRTEKPLESIYPCLECVDLTQEQKRRLTAKYEEITVVNAVDWALSQDSLSRSLIAAITYACNKQLSKEEPQKKETPYETICKSFRHGELYNNAECHLTPEVVAFTRGMRHESLKFDKFFTMEKFKALCASFAITASQPPKHATQHKPHLESEAVSEVAKNASYAQQKRSELPQRRQECLIADKVSVMVCSPRTGSYVEIEYTQPRFKEQLDDAICKARLNE